MLFSSFSLHILHLELLLLAILLSLHCSVVLLLLVLLFYLDGQVFRWFVVCSLGCCFSGGTHSHAQTRNSSLRRHVGMHSHGRWHWRGGLERSQQCTACCTTVQSSSQMTLLAYCSHPSSQLSPCSQSKSVTIKSTLFYKEF